MTERDGALPPPGDPGDPIPPPPVATAASPVAPTARPEPAASLVAEPAAPFVADPASMPRAIGAGLGFLVVALTYEASRYGDADRWWAAGATVLLGVVLADSLVDVRRLLPTPGLAPLTIVAALGAAFLCVPETDQFPVVAVLPVAVVAIEVVQRRQLGMEWYAVAAFAVAWGAMFGATGRQSALVGALFAWWPVVLPGLVHLAWRIRSTAAATAIAAAGAGGAVAMARTGGIADRWTTVIAAGAACVAASVLVAAAVARYVPPPDGSGRVSARR